MHLNNFEGLATPAIWINDIDEAGAPAPPERPRGSARGLLRHRRKHVVERVRDRVERRVSDVRRRGWERGARLDTRDLCRAASTVTRGLAVAEGRPEEAYELTGDGDDDLVRCLPARDEAAVPTCQATLSRGG
jgi:hypothetical protein